MFTILSHPVGGASIPSPLRSTDNGTPTQLEGLPLNRIALFTQCRSMPVVDNKLYTISYVAERSKFTTYLPKVTQMLGSLRISSTAT